MHRFVTIFSDSTRILFKKHLKVSARVQLLVSYYQITAKRFFDGRVFNIFNTRQQKIGPFIVELEDYSDFYWTFREIFIEEDYFFKCDSKKPRVIDCGGNIGLAVLYFKFIYPDAIVQVFEAFPKNAEILRRNIEKNNFSDITIITKAVGGSVGAMKMFGDRRAATINSTLADEHGATEGESVSIDVDLLSEYITDDIDYLKMDIEGAESSVISDLAKTNKLNLIKHITMEYHAEAGLENSLASIIEAFEKNGFISTIFAGPKSPTDMVKRDFTHVMITAVRKSNLPDYA